MKKYTVRLTFQCSEDWNKMTPNETGRHCMACNKTVIDFSTMRDEEIVQYLLKNKNSCGRFQKTQLNRPIVFFNHKRRSNWPAIAAMLIAGFVSVVPATINAAPNTKASYVYSPVDGEKEKKNVEPDKTSNYHFTIRLFNTETKAKIFYGSATIENLGVFYADANGDIQIIINDKDIPDYINLTIGTNGYGNHPFSLYRKDLKNSTSADLYINEVQMPAGMVAIDETGSVSLDENK